MGILWNRHRFEINSDACPWHRLPGMAGVYDRHCVPMASQLVCACISDGYRNTK